MDLRFSRTIQESEHRRNRRPRVLFLGHVAKRFEHDELATFDVVFESLCEFRGNQTILSTPKNQRWYGQARHLFDSVVGRLLEAFDQGCTIAFSKRKFIILLNEFVGHFVWVAINVAQTFSDDRIIALTPKKAWQFVPDTPRLLAGGWSQGAVLQVNSGRAAFFGEAAMFSAQVAGPTRAPGHERAWRGTEFSIRAQCAALVDANFVIADTTTRPRTTLEKINPSGVTFGAGCVSATMGE